MSSDWLRIPGGLSLDQTPFLFREWYCRSRVRRWMEYDRRNDFAARLAGPAPGRRILDVGCDWGYVCLRLARAGAETWGIDIDESSVEFGRHLAAANNLKVTLQYANVRSLPFPSEHFDAVTMVETIEHIPQSERPSALAEIRRVLRPAGRIIITTPNPCGLAELGKKLVGRVGFLRRRFSGSYHDDHRTRTFRTGDVMIDGLATESELRTCVAQVGLRLLEVHRIVFVTKFLPEWSLPPAKAAEWLLERTPVVRRLASTTVYVMTLR